MTQLTIVEYHSTYYYEGDNPADDPDGVFGGDYHSVHVLDPEDTIIREFGDHYHDNGAERAESFCQGFALATGGPPAINLYGMLDNNDELLTGRWQLLRPRETEDNTWRYVRVPEEGA